MEIADVVKLIEDIPTGWKVFIIFVVIALPKIANFFGGNQVIRGWVEGIASFMMRTVDRRMSQVEREYEDTIIGETYTKQLITEALKLVRERLDLMPKILSELNEVKQEVKGNSSAIVSLEGQVNTEQQKLSELLTVLENLLDLQGKGKLDGLGKDTPKD